MPEYGKAVALWRSNVSRLEVFLRSPEGTLIHSWRSDANHVVGQHIAYEDAIDLGGDLASEPVAVRRYPKDWNPDSGPPNLGVDVYARSRRNTIQHWSFDPTTSLWGGPYDLPDALVGSNPIAVSDDETLYVFAKSMDGPVLWWQGTPQGHWEQRGFIVSPRGMFGDPVALRHEPRKVDVYYYTEAADHEEKDPDYDLNVVTIDASADPKGRVSGEHTLRKGVFKFQGGPVAAISWQPGRRDLFLRGTRKLPSGQSRNSIVHFGNGFMATTDTDELRWWGPEAISTPDQEMGDPTVTSGGAGDAHVFYREGDQLAHWQWFGGTDRVWNRLGQLVGPYRSVPAIVSRDKEHIDVLLRTNDHELKCLHWFAGAIIDPPLWRMSLGRQDPPQDPLAGSTDDDPPDFLIVRPDDHLLLGVNAPNHQVVDGDAPQLTGGQGPLRLTLPPQHIAEGVLRSDDLAAADQTFPAALSGPSRVSIEAEAAMPLTSRSVLGAVDAKPVDADEDSSAIELPRGLIIKAETPDGAPAIVRHSATPVTAFGVSSVWSTRFGGASGDGGLHLRGVRAGREDAFPVPLSKGNRVLIVEQTTPARADKLELSCLGGTLTAHGQWDGFAWDHHAVGGRDVTVRTSIDGVLYPFGHRAVYVEVTERSSNEPIAVLRKRDTLYVNQPLVRPTAGAADAVQRAFPFSEVEILVREVRDIDDPNWRETARPTRAAATLQGELQTARHEQWQLNQQLFEMGWGGIGDTTEMLAVDNGVAGRCVDAAARATDIQALLDVLAELGLNTTPINTFFTPRRFTSRYRFPVRIRTASGDLVVEMPLIFVADVRLGADLREAFSTLDNPDVAARVTEAYTTEEMGAVPLPNVPIDLAPAAAARSAERVGAASAAPQTTVYEVTRLNFAGTFVKGGYLPSLGVPGDPASWAANVKVPTIRTLTGKDPTARIAFARAYLDGIADDVPTEIRGEFNEALNKVTKDLMVDFTEIADRAGGLAAPKMVVDQISQTYGLVNALGKETLDPKKLLSDGATLLGFNLSDLIASVHVPPELKTIANVGVPTAVRMTWHDVKLKDMPEGAAMFVASTDAAKPTLMQLDVLTSVDKNETTCEVRDFKLRMPPGTDKEALIELTFASLKFHQEVGRTPDLKVDITNVDFVGKLTLLQKLRELVSDFSKLPVKIDASKDKVVARYTLPLPEVKALSFVLSNVVFNAALTVPFNKDPVALEIGFASRQRPFTLTVLMFGGGGYFDMELIHSGLRRLEVSLQFGAAIGMDFVVGRAEIHAYGGIRYALVNKKAELTGYIHLGGSLDVLGLVSVSIELRVELAYDFDHDYLVGRATIVIDIDLTFYSDSFELDSGDWIIAGGSGDRQLDDSPSSPTFSVPDPDDAAANAWAEYRRAFAS